MTQGRGTAGAHSCVSRSFFRAQHSHPVPEARTFVFLLDVMPESAPLYCWVLFRGVKIPQPIRSCWALEFFPAFGHFESLEFFWHRHLVDMNPHTPLSGSAGSWLTCMFGVNRWLAVRILGVLVWIHRHHLRGSSAAPDPYPPLGIIGLLNFSSPGPWVVAFHSGFNLPFPDNY